jgi:hypothetical protein
MHVAAYPPNDNISRRTTLSGASGVVTGSTAGATAEASEPSIADSPGVKTNPSVWFKWTAPSTTVLTLDTTGSSFAAQLAVIVPDGSKEPTSTLVAESTPSRCSVVGSAGCIAVGVSSGKTVMIGLAGGESGARGPYSLRWAARGELRVCVASVRDHAVDIVLGRGVCACVMTAPVANDMFASRSTVSGTAGTLSGTVAGATLEVDEPAGFGSGELGSVWFKWVAPAGTGATLKLRIDASNAILDVRVYSDPAGTLAALTIVNEAPADTPGCTFSQCRTFVVARGQSYAVRVSGDATQGSSGAFSVPWAAAP